MPLQGDYEPSPDQLERDQVEAYERSGGQANAHRESQKPIIIVTSRGRKTGKIRKFAVMRVEHDGQYALVASKGGSPQHPLWYHNLMADPKAVEIQDGVLHEIHRLSGAGRPGPTPRALRCLRPRGPRTREGRVVDPGGRCLSAVCRLSDLHRSSNTAAGRLSGSIS
jgi:hypothetical protein